MKQRHVGIFIEFFESQDPKKIEELLRKNLPPMRRLFVTVDHKNFMYRKPKITPDMIGKDIQLTYVCPKDGTVWKGNAIAVKGGYYIWEGSDRCPVCGTKGELNSAP